MLDKPINLTPQELVMYLFAGAIAISVAREKLSKGVKIIVSIIEQWRKPEKSQNDAIQANQAKLEEHEKFLKSDNVREIRMFPNGSFNVPNYTYGIVPTITRIAVSEVNYRKKSFVKVSS